MLDISLYRDDFETSGLKRSGTTDRMPQQLNGENILLIDDVLFTGRTIRAALNVLFDYGRPGAIDLGILFDRGGRELPIEPTFLGESLGEEGVGRCKLVRTRASSAHYPGLVIRNAMHGSSCAPTHLRRTIETSLDDRRPFKTTHH